MPAGACPGKRAGVVQPATWAGLTYGSSLAQLGVRPDRVVDTASLDHLVDAELGCTSGVLSRSPNRVLRPRGGPSSQNDPAMVHVCALLSISIGRLDYL